LSEPPLGQPPVNPLPAATVILARPGPRGLEVLLTRRPATMAFGPDLYVFPGGRIDAGDAESAVAGELRGAGWSPSLAAAAAAAVREAHEEVGIEIPEPRRLLSLSRWVTPRTLPRRFDVHFFVVGVAAGTRAHSAEGEVAEARWLTPRDALDAMAGDRLEMWLPTSISLQQVAWIRDVSELAAARPSGGASADGPPDVVFEPPGIPAVGLETANAGGVDGRTATTWLIGDRELVVVDPGDPLPDSAARLEALARDRGGRLVGVALTHLDPEHHAGVELFATDLGLPVVAGRGAARLAPYELRELDDGALVPFGDVPMAAVPLPGPSPEHTGYELIRADAIAPGDLLDPPEVRSSRGVLPPPDESAWAASLDRLRARRPLTLLPSHGPAA
jgi:glyoxylase-like metal-dependent hydrolase (beta-lactamase superfamily II)/8-oxo-dGTP pyrophosphatase MutT (NUDIX family)